MLSQDYPPMVATSSLLRCVQNAVNKGLLICQPIELAGWNYQIIFEHRRFFT